MISTEDFTQALRQLPDPTAAQKKFLQAHFDSDARTSTATLLSEAAGYENYNGLNLQYGLLAANLARMLDINGDPGFGLIVDFVRPKKVTNDHWLLLMKRDFAEALLAAGWVHRA